MLEGVLNQHIQDSIIKLQMFDDRFLRLTRSVVEPSYFTSPETQLIVKIIYEFYDKYKESPKDHFRNELQTELERRKVSDAEFDIYNFYLDKLDEINANSDYILNIISSFVRRATLRDAAIKFAGFLKKDKFKEAELLMYNALKSGIMNVDTGTDLINDIEARRYRHDEKEYLLTFDIPHLDYAVGGMERKTLVLIVAPLKGLKSWFLTYLGARAISTGLKVVHFTHEMSEKKVVERYDQALFELVHVDGKVKKWRRVVWEDKPKNIGRIVDDNRDIKDCRTLKEVQYIADRLKMLKRQGGRLFVKEYSTGTCTVSEVERYIEYLQAAKGITPDVIISDYGDIMAAEGKHADERSRINSIYTRLRSLAVDRNLLMITASQGVRSAIESAHVGAQHTAEDIRKPALADLTLTVARTRTQIDLGQGTLSVVATREGEPVHFDFFSNLDFGQFYADVVPESPEDENNGA